MQLTDHPITVIPEVANQTIGWDYAVGLPTKILSPIPQYPVRHNRSFAWEPTIMAARASKCSPAIIAQTTTAKRAR